MTKKEKPFDDESVREANKLVVNVLGDAKAVIWWATENPMFGGVAPYKMIVLRREKRLLKIIQSLVEGNIA